MKKIKHSLLLRILLAFTFCLCPMFVNSGVLIFAFRKLMLEQSKSQKGVEEKTDSININKALKMSEEAPHFAADAEDEQNLNFQKVPKAGLLYNNYLTLGARIGITTLPEMKIFLKENNIYYQENKDLKQLLFYNSKIDTIFSDYMCNMFFDADNKFSFFVYAKPINKNSISEDYTAIATWLKDRTECDKEYSNIIRQTEDPSKFELIIYEYPIDRGDVDVIEIKADLKEGMLSLKCTRL